MGARLVGFALSVAIATAPAHADNPKLAAARDALAAVDYDAARVLLSGALEEGGNSPAALAEIYRLAANTAVVLNERTLAATYYRSWLSLDPNATLTTDAAAKFREPFMAAQAFVREQGAFKVKIGKRDGRTIAVAVSHDAMQLATSIALASDGPATRVPIVRGKPVVLAVPPGKAMVRVHVFDQFGNRVFERSFATFSEIPPELEPTVPLVRRWPVWAIPAVGAAAAGYYFHHEANGAQDRLDGYARTKGEVFYSDVVEATDSRDRNRRIAAGLWIGAGACAVTAFVMVVTRPDDRRVTVAPTATPSGAGVVAIGRF